MLQHFSLLSSCCFVSLPLTDGSTSCLLFLLSTHCLSPIFLSFPFFPSTSFLYIYVISLFLMSQLTRDERSDNDEEEEEESSSKEDEGAEQQKLGNGLAVDEDKNGYSSPLENFSRPKTVHWLRLHMISRAEDMRNRTMQNTCHTTWTNTKK